MKQEADGEHPASHYLVAEDPQAVTTWHLRVRDVDGKPDHTLMGAAWAALHGGYRGQEYAGPGKQEAISKLTAMYADESMDTPKSLDKAGRRIKGDMVALIAEMQAALDKLAKWASYQDEESAPAEGMQAANTAEAKQAGPSVVTPTYDDMLGLIEIEQAEIQMMEV
jgi:hypothetical protein